MKISDILVESKQLNEGPFTQAIGRGIGKVAKGVSNIGKDLKTGFKAGYSGEQPPAAPNAAPVKQPPAAPNAAPVKKKENPTWAGVKQGFARAVGPDNSTASAEKSPASTAPAKVANTTATTATEPTSQQINKAGSTETPQAQQGGQTMYAQVKANIDKLDKKGKQRIMQLLQKNLGAPATNTPATNTPGVAKSAADTVAPANRGARKPAKPTQAEIDADRERIMGSIVRTGKVVAESFSLFRKQ